MTGKIPYILIGHVQMAIIIGMATVLFNVPFVGNPFALYMAAILFIAANLTFRTGEAMYTLIEASKMMNMLGAHAEILRQRMPFFPRPS